MKKKTVEASIAADVDNYLADLSPENRQMLEQLRQTILAAAPQAEEVISYRMPAYKYHGPVVFFAAFKNHCSLYAVSRTILEKFSRELSKFHIANTTIHFSAENPLPQALVKKIVRARLKENIDRVKLKK